MRRSRIVVMLAAAALLVGSTLPSAQGQLGAQTTDAKMTVSPQSGVRPLTVTVTGTSCAKLRLTTDAPPLEIHLRWQVEGNPSTLQTRVIADGSPADTWSTAIVFGIPNIGTNVVSAVCRGTNGPLEATYPDQKVQVLPVAPVLSASPTSITVGQSITAIADRCPDPDLPQLGATYSVVFRLDYLVPPDVSAGPYSETITVQTNSAGVASTVFHVPLGAPTAGGAYRLSAHCSGEELGGTFIVFHYVPVAISVAAAPTPTPVPTVTVVPTTTPGPTPTTTPAPTATPGPTPTPQPTPTPGPGIGFTG